MKKYFTQYRAFVLKCLENDNTDFAKLLEYHKKHIDFFMHERFIHLIVMFLFAIITVALFVIIVCTQQIILFPLALLTLALLIPYISHYYFLENQTQMLYKDYEKIYEKVSGFSTENFEKVD